MPDAQFDDPRLAAIYDALDADRSDLEHYAAMVDEFAASSVLDIGCGTGCLAVMLAERGETQVVGIDPAAASLDVARDKPFAEQVRWIHGTAGTLPPDVQVDLAVMTGNVAQVFWDDADWQETLDGIHSALRPHGRFVFETRVPSFRAWEGWTKERTFRSVEIPGVGVVERWVQVTDASMPFVTFESPSHFLATGDVVHSTSTLVFRERAEIESSLEHAGFKVLEIREAPDRPGKEWVFITERTSPD